MKGKTLSEKRTQGSSSGTCRDDRTQAKRPLTADDDCCQKMGIRYELLNQNSKDLQHQLLVTGWRASTIVLESHTYSNLCYEEI